MNFITELTTKLRVRGKLVSYFCKLLVLSLKLLQQWDVADSIGRILLQREVRPEQPLFLSHRSRPKSRPWDEDASDEEKTRKIKIAFWLHNYSEIKIILKNKPWKYKYNKLNKTKWKKIHLMKW